MKTLLVLRHAKASEADAAASDHTRPLTKKGQKAARRIGKVLREKELAPQVVVSSTALRARETAEIVTEVIGHTAPIRFLDELYLAEPAAYFEALQRVTDSAPLVLVVGHNPGLEALVLHLTGQSVYMPTGALVECSLLIEAWSELNSHSEAKVLRVFRPKELDS